MCRSRVLLVATLAFGLVPTLAAAQTVTINSTDTPRDIPTPTASAGEITSSALNETTGTITDINVSIDITHTYDGDLDISVISPLGTEVLLSSTNGEDGEDYTGTTFDDEGMDGAIGAAGAPYSGSFTPDNALSAIDGEGAAGVWSIKVDDTHTDDVGTLNFWSIVLTVDLCGNGSVVAGEDCDDLGASGCCTATCAYEAATTACGDSSDTECTDPNTCNATGTCDDNHEVDGSDCGGTGTECIVQDTCSTGVCTDNGFVGSGTACGDGSDTECTDPDTCDGSGACGVNHAGNGSDCGDTGTECTNQDTCLAGACDDQGFVGSGTACGDASDTDCTDADTCDGAGACDDNHAVDGGSCDNGTFCDGADTCSSGDCSVSAGDPCGATQTCSEGMTMCLENCGNGSVEVPEECDDGGANSDTDADACRTTCLAASCGDGVVDTGEECDDGGANSDTDADACRTTCLAASCGDGVVDTGEDCDDSNMDSADGCSDLCAAEDGSIGGDGGWCSVSPAAEREIGFPMGVFILAWAGTLGWRRRR